MFCLKYKRENPSHVLGDSLCCVYESFVRSRGGCLHTYLGYQELDYVKSLMINSVAALRA